MRDILSGYLVLHVDELQDIRIRIVVSESTMPRPNKQGQGCGNKPYRSKGTGI
jgi:hypothetical protein